MSNGYYFVNTSQGTNAVSGFLDGFTKMQKLKQSKQDSETKKNYYEAMIQNSKEKMQLAREHEANSNARAKQGMGLRAQSMANTEKYRAASLADRAAGRKDLAGYRDRTATEHERHNRELEKGKAAGTFDPTKVDTPDVVGPGAGSKSNPAGAPTVGSPTKPWPVSDASGAPAAYGAAGGNGQPTDGWGAQPDPTQPQPQPTESAVPDEDEERQAQERQDLTQEDQEDDDERERLAEAQPEEEEGDEEEEPTPAVDDEGEETQMLAEGGDVQGDDGSPDAPKGAVNADSDGTADGDAGGEPSSAPVTQSGNSGTKSRDGFDMGTVLKRWKEDPDNPVHGGLMGIMAGYQMQQQGAVDAGYGSPQDNPHNFSKGTLAMSDADLEKAEKTVDPAGDLNKSARTMKVLDAGYHFYLDRGDINKAHQFAASALEKSRMDSQKYGAYAVDLLRKGDKAGALDFIKKAYDLVPDGQSLDATIDPQGNFHAWTIDQTSGEKKDLGTVGPAQVFKLATGIANGTEYVQRLTQIGGGGRNGTKASGPMGAPKMADMTTAAGDVEGVAKNYPNLDKTTAPQVKDLAARIHASSGLSPDEAIGAVDELTRNDKLKIQRDPNTGDGMVTLGNGMRFKLSNNDIARVAMLRAKSSAMGQARDQKAAKDKAGADANAAEQAGQAQTAAERRPAEEATMPGILPHQPVTLAGRADRNAPMRKRAKEIAASAVPADDEE